MRRDSLSTDLFSTTDYLHRRITHLANDLVQQEIVKLAQNEQNRGENVVPHGANFVENAQYDVQHECKIQQSSAKKNYDQRNAGELGYLTHAPGHIVVKTNKGTL